MPIDAARRVAEAYSGTRHATDGVVAAIMAGLHHHPHLSLR